MFGLGVLAVLQVCCGPGLIAARLLKLKQGFLQGTVTIFMLSLTGNYLAVFLLAALGLYTRPVVLGLLGLELVALAGLYWRAFLIPLDGLAQAGLERTGQFMSGLLPEPEPDGGRAFARALKGILAVGLAVMAVSSIAWVVRVGIDNLGSVFNSWDAVLSWNRWAVDWAHNGLPVGTWQYPQLLPANWSLIYVISGSEMQIFAKAIIPLFSLLMLVMMFDLGLDAAQAKNAGRALGLFLGVVITRLMLKKFLGDYISEGYADIPVALAGFVPVYMLLKARRLAGEERLKAVQLGAVLAGGAAVTKQAGIVILALYPLLAWLLVLHEFAGPLEAASEGVKGAGGRRAWRSLAVGLVAALVIALPWYAYKQVQISQGVDQTNIEQVTNSIYQGAGLVERAAAAVDSLGKYAWLLAFLGPGLLVLDKAYRWIVVLVVLPFSVFWALYFSYDARNLALALPLIGLTSGVGLGRCAELGIDLLARLRAARLRAYALAGLGLAALAVGGLALPAQQLEAQQAAAQKQIFNPDLNAKLYDFIAKNGANNGPDVRIATNYPVAALPGLEDNQVNFWYADFDTYQNLVETQQANYLLVPPSIDARIEQDIEAKLEAGEYKLVFEDEHYVPYRFIRVKRGN